MEAKRDALNSRCQWSELYHEGTSDLQRGVHRSRHHRAWHFEELDPAVWLMHAGVLIIQEVQARCPRLLMTLYMDTGNGMLLCVMHV